MTPCVISTHAMSFVEKTIEEKRLEEELAKIDPATLQYLKQFLAEKDSAVRKIVQNVRDEPIPQEAEKRLQKPLPSKPYQPRPHRPTKTPTPAKKNRGRFFLIESSSPHSSRVGTGQIIF